MAKLISLFNHKGGVSKTTTTFNLGWSLAEKGHKVLIVDGDPQCNLTGTALRLDDDEDFTKLYDKNPNSNINACLSPLFLGEGAPLQAATPLPTRHKNLWILAGHIDLSEAETQLTMAIGAGS